MGHEDVWRVGHTMRSIYSTLHSILRVVEKSADPYLDDAFLGRAKVRKQGWDLEAEDEFFACMPEEDFADLKPSAPLESWIEYEDVEYPRYPQLHQVWDFERSAIGIGLWFKALHDSKVSRDGCGCRWPRGISSWIPRDKFTYEDLYDGRRMPPSVPFQLLSAYFNDDKPHQVYHAWFGDEGREGVILRSELQILIRCMKRRMADPLLCVHNVPVLLLSIHGHKARIMIAHFNTVTKQLDIKCSPFEQFNGFEADEEYRTTDGRSRPADFKAKRDLFFRWLSPVCQGDTFLIDSRDAPEMVLRGSKGRRRLVPRQLSRDSPSSESSETLG